MINIFKIMQNCNKLISQTRQKGYHYPQVVLTRLDHVEKSLPADTPDRDLRLRTLIDEKIESVVMRLGVTRTAVHFIENYHGESTIGDRVIDIHALRVLHECMQHGERYLEAELARTRRANCSVQ